ncbi:hypothetical protein [Thermocrinis sp.]
MRKLKVKDRNIARRLEDRLIKKGLVVAICEKGEKSPMVEKAHVLIQVEGSEPEKPQGVVYGGDVSEDDGKP